MTGKFAAHHLLTFGPLVKIVRRRVNTYFESLTTWLNMGWAPLTGMIHDDDKFINLPIAELYDLPKDPEEEHNIVDDERRKAVQIRDLLQKETPPPTYETRDVSSEESSKLMSLGYVSGNAAKTTYTKDDDPKRLVKYYEMQNEVVELYQAGRTDDAIARARELIKIRPEMSTTKDMLGFLLQESEKPTQAIDFLEAEVAKGTASATMRKRLGLVLSESGRAAEAVKVLKEFEDSRDPDLLNAYGIALADTGHLQNAVEQFQKVLAIDQTNATALANLGVVALRANDLQRAFDYLTRALQLNPDMPLALNTIGVVYARTGDDQRAIEAWMKAVQLDREQYDAMFNLAVVAQRAGRPEVARKALEQFIQTAPPERYGRDLESAREMLATLGSR